MRKIDLHLHTTHSDGSCTPAQLIARCRDKGLTCVSIADHDTMTGCEEGRREAQAAGIEFITGVEVSAEFQPGTMHILGYFMNENHPRLKSTLEHIQKARSERNQQITQRLNALGFEVSLEEIIQEVYGTAEIPPGKQLGRPHFAHLMIKKGFVKDFDEAFNRYLAKDQPAYVNKSRLTSERAIELIREAGGIASLAHPKQMKLDGEALKTEVGKLVDQGLEAVEVYSSCHSQQESSFYLRIARQFLLAVTGGSDFHGTNKSEIDVGYMGDGITLDYEIVEALRERILQRK